jgi:DNA polymerase sigma
MNTGMTSLSMTRELIIRYPIIQYLIFPLKKLLILHDLNNPYKGGLNSYSIVVWLAAFV